MDVHLQKKICARIKQARVEAGLTQEEMADLLNVRTRTYWNYENDRVPFRSISQISRATGRSEDWLLRGDSAGPASAGEIARLLAQVQSLEDSVGEIREMLRELLPELRGSSGE